MKDWARKTGGSFADLAAALPDYLRGLPRTSEELLSVQLLGFDEAKQRIRFCSFDTQDEFRCQEMRSEGAGYSIAGSGVRCIVEQVCDRFADGRHAGAGLTLQECEEWLRLQIANLASKHVEVNANVLCDYVTAPEFCVQDGSSYGRTSHNQVTGAGRAYSSLDSNNQLTSQLHCRPLTAAGAITTANGLSQSGTTILIAASTVRFGSNSVSYNSGSVNPGSYGTYYIYADDPTFAGGAVTYIATTSKLDLMSNDNRICFGSITTLSGGGGTGGGSDACFSPNTKVRTRRGDLPFSEIQEGDFVLTARGTWRKVLKVTDRPFSGEGLDMGDDEWVTMTHHFQHEGSWVPVGEFSTWPQKHYEGTIHNLHVETDAGDDVNAPDTEHSYTLANGKVVHNYLPT